MNERKKKESREKARGIQQIPVRFHINDLKALKKVLIDEDVTFQGFVTACSKAMVEGDARVVQIVRAWKVEESIPHEERSKYMLSKTERDSLLDELGKEDEP